MEYSEFDDRLYFTDGETIYRTDCPDCLLKQAVCDVSSVGITDMIIHNARGRLYFCNSNGIYWLDIDKTDAELPLTSGDIENVADGGNDPGSGVVNIGLLKSPLS